MKKNNKMATERKNIKRNKTRRGVNERNYFPSIQRNYNGKIVVENSGQLKLL